MRYFLKAQHDPMGRTLLVERVESCKENQLVNRNNNLPNIYIYIYIYIFKAFKNANILFVIKLG